MYSAEAAVGLLIGHECWLCRSDFVGEFVETGRGLVSDELMAWVDWEAAVTALDSGRLAGSDSEAGVLRITASLAVGLPVDLGDALSGLDAANVVLVAVAVLAANGGDVSVALGEATGW